MCVISKILLVAEDNNNYILTRGNQEITNGEDEAEEEESLCTTTHCRLKCHGLGMGLTVKLQEDILVACTDLHLPIFVQKPNEIRIEESV